MEITNLTEVLQKLELSPMAIKIYLALLDLGKSTADTLAKRAGTYKANTYDALERLMEVGLAGVIYEENKRFFIPTNPEKLPQVVQDLQEQEMFRLEELKKDLQGIMPQLTARYGCVKEKELFEIYRGRKAYKAIINEILGERPKFWKGFGNLQVQEHFPLEFKRWFTQCPLRLFSTKSTVVLHRLKEAQKTAKVEIHWLPKEVYMPIVWVVFGDNVLIIIYEPDLIVMRIKSEKVVKTYSSQFDYLWGKYVG